MQSLTKLQHDFQAYLLQAPTTIAESIVATENVTREARLALYGDAYRERLIEALCNNYPKLFCYLGEGQFRELALQYIAHYPSGFRSIRFFGGRLAMFLNKTVPYSEEGVLAELADFEWTLAYVFLLMIFLHYYLMLCSTLTKFENKAIVGFCQINSLLCLVMTLS